MIVPLHFSDDENSNFESSDKPSYDELQYSFNDFHGECLKFYILCNKQNKTISSLESKSKSIPDELDKSKFNIQGSCSTCNICKYEKSKHGFKYVLCN